jgi:hypothetical protein
MSIIDRNKLMSALRYDQQTGLFERIISIGGKAAGTIAGTPTADGYIKIRYGGKRYFAHRLAWFYVYGEFPKHDIDHINGIRSDNRISNLRDVSNIVNSQNRKKPRSGKAAGNIGVDWKANAKKWRARIVCEGKPIHIGYFSSHEAAYDAYCQKKRLLHKGSTL